MTFPKTVSLKDHLGSSRFLSKKQSRVTAGRLSNYKPNCDVKGVGDRDGCRAASLISVHFSSSNFWNRYWCNLLYYSVWLTLQLTELSAARQERRFVVRQDFIAEPWPGCTLFILAFSQCKQWPKPLRWKSKAWCGMAVVQVNFSWQKTARNNLLKKEDNKEKSSPKAHDLLLV